MTRRLSDVMLDLEPTPRLYELRTGASDPAFGSVDDPDELADIIRWDLGGSIRSPERGGWLYLGELWGQRFTLPRDSMGEVAIDLDADGDPDPLYRWVALPPLSAAGVREWGGIMVAASIPELTAIRWRLVSGASTLWWNGASWAAVATDDDWTTTEDLEAHFADLEPSVRAFTLRALLESVDPDRIARPELYGVRILARLRDRGDEDDALVRTLIPALRAAVRTIAQTKATLPAATVELRAPTPYEIMGAPEVFDLTEDPDETTPLTGTYADGVFVLDATLPAGTEVLAEWPIRPRVVTSVHRDADPDVLPAVYIFPASISRIPGQGEVRLTAAHSGDPTGVEMRSPDLLQHRLEVRAVAMNATQARRIVADLEDWVRTHSCLISPESGREIGVRSVAPMVSTAGSLSAGVVDARGTWEIEVQAAGAATSEPVDYARSDGLVVAVIPPEE